MPEANSFNYIYNVTGPKTISASGTQPTPEQVLAVLQAAAAAQGWTVIGK